MSLNRPLLELWLYIQGFNETVCLSSFLHCARANALLVWTSAVSSPLPWEWGSEGEETTKIQTNAYLNCAAQSKALADFVKNQ